MLKYLILSYSCLFSFYAQASGNCVNITDVSSWSKSIHTEGELAEDLISATINYVDSKNEKTVRKIRVINSTRYHEKIYIHTYDNLRKALRTFRADRVVSVKNTNDSSFHKLVISADKVCF